MKLYSHSHVVMLASAVNNNNKPQSDVHVHSVIHFQNAQNLMSETISSHSSKSHLLVFFLWQVSTKSGLDPSGVWQAWGMASLIAGNLSGAREKFARCLKPPMDRNQLSLGPPLLQEVIKHLETHVSPTLVPVGRNITAL